MDLCSALRARPGSRSSWGPRCASGDPPGPVEGQQGAEVKDQGCKAFTVHMLMMVKLISRYLQCRLPNVSLGVLHTAQELSHVFHRCVDNIECNIS